MQPNGNVVVDTIYRTAEHGYATATGDVIFNATQVIDPVPRCTPSR
ncbi:hypothetical protein [Corynebacterium diphtheriae]|nr:hypothetical protein [Corynebacterium diphtheriae]